jgi:hypothetical protein
VGAVKESGNLGYSEGVKAAKSCNKIARGVPGNLGGLGDLAAAQSTLARKRQKQLRHPDCVFRFETFGLFTT